MLGALGKSICWDSNLPTNTSALPRPTVGVSIGWLQLGGLLVESLTKGGPCSQPAWLPV